MGNDQSPNDLVSRHRDKFKSDAASQPDHLSGIGLSMSSYSISEDRYPEDDTDQSLEIEE